MLKRARLLAVSLSFLSLSFACGRDDHNESTINDQSPATVASGSEPSSTLTTVCEAVPLPVSTPSSFCRTLPNGTVYSVALKASTFEQDPVTCAITSPDDGMRASLIEMGFTPCDASESSAS